MRINRLIEDREDLSREVAVQTFLARRSWPQEPFSPPHPYSVEDREDVAQELRTAHWRGLSLPSTFDTWCQEQARQCGRFTDYASASIWHV